MTTFDRAFKSFHEVRVGASNDHKVCVASRLAGGSDPLHCIIDSSDVVVENFSARVMRSLGLDYASLSSNHPGLIMLSMSGLGRSVPDPTSSHTDRYCRPTADGCPSWAWCYPMTRLSVSDREESDLPGPTSQPVQPEPWGFSRA